jgi:hypothetical protein
VSVPEGHFRFSDIPRVTHPLLVSAVEKVRWAEIHLEALQANIWGYWREPSNAPLLRADLDPQTGYHVFRIKGLPDYSLFRVDAALGIGDVVGNIRAALDHAMWAITNDDVNTGVHPDPEGIAFPIRDDVGKLSGSRVERAVKPYVSSDVWNIVLQSLLDQPYPGVDGISGDRGRWQSGDNHPLRILQDRSNYDKHRLLPTVLLVPQGILMANVGQFSLAAEPGDVADMVWTGYGRPIELDVEAFRARLFDSPEPHIENAGQMMPDIAFQDRLLVTGTLDRVACFVKFLLTEFERVLPAIP